MIFAKVQGLICAGRRAVNTTVAASMEKTYMAWLLNRQMADFLRQRLNRMLVEPANGGSFWT